MRATGTRFFIVGLLGLFMFIPLFFAGAVINDRAGYSRDASRTIAEEWGGAQVLRGPQLIVPVVETVTEQRRVDLIDEITDLPQRDARSGDVLYRVEEVEREEERAAVYLLPEKFDVDLTTQSDIRRRGIFRVPVYRATAAIDFDFDTEAVEGALRDGQVAQWDAARIVFALTSNRALRGPATLLVDGAEVKLDPWATQGAGQGTGIVAEVGDIREAGEFALSLSFQGAEELRLAPVGRTTRVSMDSDWPHPSFGGAFLPDTSDISDDGFRAEWTIPHLARAIPEVSRESLLPLARGEAFGLRFFQPNDFYQKAYRAARYGILFIALTFLTVLLLDRASARPAHPVQYILIGLAQSMFVVLMVAYAEQIGFAAAYALSAFAVVALLTLYAATGLGLGRRSLILGAMLAVLYGVLFMILRSADYALLAGSTLVFAALAGTMFATRNEDWYAPGGAGAGSRGRGWGPWRRVTPDTASDQT